MQLEIVTPENKLFSGDIKLVQLPGSKGSFEILRNHAPIISTLDIGIVKLITIEGKEMQFEIKGGVVEGKVLLSERAAWEMEIGSIESTRSANLILNKKFLSCINDSVESIEFSIFDTFMLVKDDYSNLMLSFEQDFEDED